MTDKARIYRSFLKTIVADQIKLSMIWKAVFIANRGHADEKCLMVRAVGIEPTLLAEPDFESRLKFNKLMIYHNNTSI